MKIYRVRKIASALTAEQARHLRSLDPSLGWQECGTVDTPTHKARCSIHVVPAYTLTRRVEFLREHHIDGKTLARLLPAWAKPKKLPSMGAKVTAFYAENNKVICDRSALVVGSDEWHELQETLPDPFRATRRYLVEKYGRAYA